MKNKITIIVGSTLVLAALVFITLRLWTLHGELSSWNPDENAFIVLMGSVIIYFFSSFLLSTAWTKLLLWFGETLAETKIHRSIYARSQIAKYIPGNIMHIAGRHLLSRNFKISQGPLVFAAIYEIMLLLIAACSISLLGWTIFRVTQTSISGSVIIIIVFIMPVISLLIAINAPRIPFLRKYNLPLRSLKEIVSGLASPFLMYLLFIMGSGLALLGTSYAIVGKIDLLSIVETISIFSVAYIAGFITPGAPSGIGIREGILAISFSSTYGAANALLIALLFRVVTILGDIIFFLTGLRNTTK